MPMHQNCHLCIRFIWFVFAVFIKEACQQGRKLEKEGVRHFTYCLSMLRNKLLSPRINIIGIVSEFVPLGQSKPGDWLYLNCKLQQLFHLYLVMGVRMQVVPGLFFALMWMRVNVFIFFLTWVTRFFKMFFITKSPMSLIIVLAKTFHFKKV